MIYTHTCDATVSVLLVNSCFIKFEVQFVNLEYNGSIVEHTNRFYPMLWYLTIVRIDLEINVIKKTVIN